MNCPRCDGCCARERIDTEDGPWVAQRCLVCGCCWDALVLRHWQHPPDAPHHTATLPIYGASRGGGPQRRRLQRDQDDIE